jgi:hypothetical protein
MRLQVGRVALAAAVAALSVTAAGADQLQSLLKLFSDSQNNYVLTGALSYQKPWGERYALTTRALVDGISSASQRAGDSVAEAYLGGYSNRQRDRYKPSQPNWQRARYELSAFGDGAWGENRGALGYIYSYESLYESHTAFASIRRSFFLQNSVAGLTWYHNFDAVRAADDERSGELDLPGRKDADGAAATWQQVLGRKTAAIFGLSARFERGALESPERDMVLTSPGGEPFVAAERLPESRRRAAASARLAQYLWQGSAINLDYQRDADEWGNDGHSARASWSWRASSGTTLTLRARYHTQAQSAYTTFSAVPGRDEFYTADAKYQGFDSWLGGFRVDFLSPAAPGRGAEVSGGFDADLYYQTPREGLQEGYYAPIVGGNVLFRF